MKGLKVGHFTDSEAGTGLTVLLFEEPAVASYNIPGLAPASHEMLLLNPEMSVANINALLLTGGSALGLAAVKGVCDFLIQHETGLRLPHGGVIPIVPALGIYDLAYKKPVIPTEQAAYKACQSAKENHTESGQIGAGTGASVGKLIKEACPMTGGSGYAHITLKNDVEVAVYVVVNAVGDVRDEHNKIIAGASTEDGNFFNSEQYLQSLQSDFVFFESSNTTLVVVVTDAVFSKSELKQISKMAVAGMARAISPIFTPFDGDALLSISMGQKEAPVITIGTIAAELVRAAIVNAVKHSEIIA